jgi:hypothetical protein
MSTQVNLLYYEVKLSSDLVQYQCQYQGRVIAQAKVVILIIPNFLIMTSPRTFEQTIKPIGTVRVVRLPWSVA